MAILSYGLWQRVFGGAPDVVGRSVSLNRQIHTVVGVMPATFAFPLPGMDQGDAADLFIPMAFTREELADEGDNSDYSVVGRLPPLRAASACFSSVGLPPWPSSSRPSASTASLRILLFAAFMRWGFASL